MKVNHRKIKKFKGGGMDMGNKSNQEQSAAMGNTSVGRRDSNLGGPTSTMGGAGNVLNTQTNQVTAKSGPVQVPTIGPFTYAFNKISKGLYNAKNLKEQKKEDVLGGEMLTTGQKTTGPAMMGGDNNNNNNLCPDGTTPPCKTPTTQKFELGGEIVISSNVDKNLL